MKILYITTIGSTMNFFKSFIKELVDAGHTVDIATNEALAPVPEVYTRLGCRQYHLDCTRSPFDKGNITCIKQIRNLVKKNKYDIVHCHTPIAAACTRIACKNLRGKTVKDADGTEHRLRVFYTAHGFHFYKGAPKKNWIIYYPVEWLCAHWTDCLITINKEDYALAQKDFSFGGKCKVEYIPGVGIDVDKFKNTVVDRKVKRAELGIPEDAFLLLSVGELNENKNHQIVIKALAELMKTEEGKAKNYYYIIAGEGPLKEYLNNLAKELGVGDKVRLLGFRSDCNELYKTADVDVFPSIREGLGLAAVEGMATGLPLICADNRGTRDYAIDGQNAFVCRDNTTEAYVKAIKSASCNGNHLCQMTEIALKTAENFSVKNSLKTQQGVYFENIN